MSFFLIVYLYKGSATFSYIWRGVKIEKSVSVVCVFVCVFLPGVYTCMCLCVCVSEKRCTVGAMCYLPHRMQLQQVNSSFIMVCECVHLHVRVCFTVISVKQGFLCHLCLSFVPSVLNPRPALQLNVPLGQERSNLISNPLFFFFAPGKPTKHVSAITFA